MPLPIKLLIATGNAHKVEEIAATFEMLACEDGAEAPQLLTLRDLDTEIDEPIEDGDTFEANALKKARHYARAADMLCLADDSGLEVDALDGAPGVISARYAGVTGERSDIDKANNRKLIDELGDTPIDQRTARFVCAMIVVDPGKPEGEDVIASVRGTVEGRILTREEAGADATGRGTNGFGYDPLFLVAGEGRTSAELSPDHKNAISHRGQAVRKMWMQLRDLSG